MKERFEIQRCGGGIYLRGGGEGVRMRDTELMTSGKPRDGHLTLQPFGLSVPLGIDPQATYREMLDDDNRVASASLRMRTKRVESALRSGRSDEGGSRWLSVASLVTHRPPTSSFTSFYRSHPA